MERERRDGPACIRRTARAVVEALTKVPQSQSILYPENPEHNIRPPCYQAAFRAISRRKVNLEHIDIDTSNVRQTSDRTAATIRHHYCILFEARHTRSPEKANGTIVNTEVRVTTDSIPSISFLRKLLQYSRPNTKRRIKPCGETQPLRLHAAMQPSPRLRLFSFCAPPQALMVRLCGRLPQPSALPTEHGRFSSQTSTPPPTKKQQHE